LEDPTIYIYLPIDFDLKFEILSFTCSLEVNGQVTSIPVEGNVLSREIIEWIQPTDGPSEMLIDDIKARGPDGVSRILRAISIHFIDN